MTTFFNKLNIKFPRKIMESEYISMQNRNQIADFKITMLVLLLVNFVTLVTTLIHPSFKDIIIILAIIGALGIIFFLKRCFPKKINYLVLLALLAYNLYRLFSMANYFSEIPKTLFFSSGYSYAVLQTILLSRIHNLYYKSAGVIVCFLLRFGVIIGLWGESPVDVPTLIRHAIIDSFVIYYFYSQEKTSRNIFRDFCVERDELSKFKELLEDHLPASVAVFDLFIRQPLFSNSAYQHTFKFCSSENNSLNYKPGVFISKEDAMYISHHNILDGALRIERDTLKEIGKPDKDLSSLKFSGTLRSMIQTLIENKKLTDTNAFSVTAYYSEREIKSFRVILNRIKWNRIDAVALILHDITDQEKVTTLKLANQHKDKIIATVSHELRTPLNGIIGLLDMAAEKAANSEAINFISLSKDNANLLLSLVNSHLDLQQIRAGKLRINPSRVCISKVLNDVIQLLQFQTKQKGIYLQAEISEKVPRNVITDENRLKQILINLIGNAVKFTSNGGITVEVCLDKGDERCLRISVIDTGIGIKEEDQGRLFQMYERIEEDKSINKNGVGLGLVISNVLARILGGRVDEKGIQVKSEYGVGSRFYFKIRKDLQNLAGDDYNKEENSSQEKLIQSKEYLDAPVEYDFDEFSTPVTPATPDCSRLTQGFLMSRDLQIRMSAYRPTKKLTIERINSKNSMNRSQLIDLRNDSQIGNCNSDTEIKDQCILVVDDNPFNLLVVSNMIKDIGIPLKTASSGQDAIETVKLCASRGETIKVILMDCHMPMMDGYETTSILKGMMENGEAPTTTILALTAGISEHEITKSKECGMKSYLTKPLTKEALLKELSKL